MADKLLPILWASVSSSMNILFVAAVGGIVSHRSSALDPKATEKMGRLIMDYVLPCLLFAQVGEISSRSDIFSLWPIPVFTFVTILTNLISSFLFSKLCLFDGERTRFVMLACTFGNATSIPLAVVSAAFQITPEIFVSPNENLQQAIVKGQAYVLLYTLFETFVRYSIGMKLISGFGSSSIKTSEIGPSAKDPSEDLTEETPLIKFSHQPKEKLDNQPYKFLLSFTNQTTEPQQQHPIIKTGLRIYHAIPIPVLFCIISVCVGISPLKYLFFKSPISVFFPNPPLMWVIDGAKMLGQCFAPLAVVTLGSNIYHTATAANPVYDIKLLSAISFWRLLVVPGTIILLLFFVFYRMLGFMQDRILLFVMLAEAITPSATSLVVMCGTHDFMVSHASQALLCEYILSIFTMTAYLFVVLVLLTMF